VTLNFPQPSEVQCCPSCQIIARAVARLAYALGYTETGDEITELMGEEEALANTINELIEARIKEALANVRVIGDQLWDGS
jgi:hypothetical protein